MREKKRKKLTFRFCMSVLSWSCGTSFPMATTMFSYPCSDRVMSDDRYWDAVRWAQKAISVTTWHAYERVILILSIGLQCHQFLSIDSSGRFCYQSFEGQDLFDKSFFLVSLNNTFAKSTFINVSFPIKMHFMMLPSISKSISWRNIYSCIVICYIFKLHFFRLQFLKYLVPSTTVGFRILG